MQAQLADSPLERHVRGADFDGHVMEWGVVVGILLVVLTLLALAWLAVLYASRKQDEILETQIQGWRQQQLLQTRKKTEEMDAALESWLLGLGLPQLEAQTQRQEAARQLSTALIEILLETPCHRQICTADLQSRRLRWD